MREKLLKESRSPFRGVRRVVWIALSASAGVGLLIMGVRSFSGETVLLNDLGIQLIAFFLFSTFVFLDRSRED
ncbi:putative membrane protein [Prochlorococcus sp. MIT 0602]|nr:putative membrane protein [Prochlorococcus sp. MIT 0602]